VRLSRSEKRLLALLAVACVVLALLTLRRPRPAPDPLRQPTDLYPHVNASETFRLDPTWPAPSSEVQPGEITGVAVGPDEQVWVLGLGRPPVRVYDPRGKFVRGWGADQIVQGHQIRLDSQGFVWVADCGRHCIHKFQPDGTRLLTLGTPGDPGEDATHFHEPTDMAVTANGDVFVADGYVNTRVAHFRGDGTFVNAWGTRGSRPGQFSLVHAIVADRRGRLLVADRNNARVQVFDQDGHFLTQWVNVVIPWGLWLTPHAEVWVCGSSPAGWKEDAFALATPPHDQVLMRFDLDGRLLQLWAVPFGDQPGQLNWVHGIAADSHGNLYCGDYRGGRVQKFVRVPPAEGTQGP
jgi:NHL repeat